MWVVGMAAGHNRCVWWRYKGSRGDGRRFGKPEVVKRSGAAGLMFVGSEIATAVSGCREESNGADVRGRESVGVQLVVEERERGKETEGRRK